MIDTKFMWGTDYGKDLLTDLNQLAHNKGTDGLHRDAFQRAFKEIVRLRRERDHWREMWVSVAGAPKDGGKG